MFKGFLLAAALTLGLVFGAHGAAAASQPTGAGIRTPAACPVGVECGGIVCWTDYEYSFLWKGYVAVTHCAGL